LAYYLSRRKGSPFWYSKVRLPGGIYLDWQSTAQRAKRDAERVAQKREADALAGRSETSLEDALEMLTQHMIDQKNSEKTLEILELKGRHLCNVFGASRDLQSIQLADTEDYMRKRRADNVGDATIAKELGYLLQAMRRCKRHKLYHGDPSDLWPDALAKTFAGRRRWLLWQEYLAAIDHIAEQWRDHLIVYTATGVRYSELYTLHVRDIDFERGIVHVRGTKTVGADRQLPISAEAREALWRRAQRSSDGLLFHITSTGKGSREDNQKRAWLRALSSACRAAKIAHASTNDLRRTFVSWCWHNGMDILAVQRWMGHGSKKMIEQVYAQPDIEHYREEIAKFPARYMPSVDSSLH
jgi:integrase/recombinase XerD